MTFEEWFRQFSIPDWDAKDAAMVAWHTAKSQEREECAYIAECHVDDENRVGYVIAKAIRERGK